MLRLRVLSQSSFNSCYRSWSHSASLHLLFGHAQLGLYRSVAHIDRLQFQQVSLSGDSPLRLLWEWWCEMEEQGEGALGAVMLRAAYQEVVLDSCDPLLEM